VTVARELELDGAKLLAMTLTDIDREFTVVEDAYVAPSASTV
jgi:hypothetical protein